MVDGVEVGDVDAQALAHGGVRVVAVLAVGDGLVAVEERRLLPREGHHGITGVVRRAVDVEVDEVDVPVVFVAALGWQRVVDDAGVVVEAEVEVVLEILRVADGDHHLLEVQALVFGHESLKLLPGHTPDVVPSGVGHGGEHRVAGHRDAAKHFLGYRVGDDGVHPVLATHRRPNGVAREERVDLQFGKDVIDAIGLIVNEEELLPFGGEAELQHERVLLFGSVAVALGLVVEAQIHRVGRGEGTRLRLHDGVEADARRGQVFAHKGVADGVAVHAAIGVEHVEGGAVAVGRTQREAVVHQHRVVGPFRRVGVEVGLAEVVEEGQKPRLGDAFRHWGLLRRGPKRSQYLLGGGWDDRKPQGQSQNEYLKSRLHIHSRWFQ